LADWISLNKVSLSDTLFTYVSISQSQQVGATSGVLLAGRCGTFNATFMVKACCAGLQRCGGIFSWNLTGVLKGEQVTALLDS